MRSLTTTSSGVIGVIAVTSTSRCYSDTTLRIPGLCGAKASGRSNWALRRCGSGLPVSMSLPCSSEYTWGPQVDAAKRRAVPVADFHGERALLAQENCRSNVVAEPSA